MRQPTGSTHFPYPTLFRSVQILEDGFDKKARKAVRDGGNIFKEKLMEDTPRGLLAKESKSPFFQKDFSEERTDLIFENK